MDMLTITISILILLLVSTISKAQPPPPEWQKDINDNNLLYSNRQTFTEGLLPPIGNGFISGDGGVLLKDGCFKPSGLADDPYWYFSGCGRVNIAGVFNNGEGTNDIIPHRASIPNPHSIYIKNANINLGTALDIKHNFFYNKSTVTCLNDKTLKVNVTLTQYMHRLYHQLQVLQFEMDDTHINDNNNINCQIELQPVQYETYEYDFIVNNSISSTTAKHLTVKLMEEPPANSTMKPVLPTAIAQVFDQVPTVITLSNNNNNNDNNNNNNVNTFLAVYKTTIEKTKDVLDTNKILEKAKKELEFFSTIPSDKLKEQHIDAWDKMFQSGIDIQGNATVAKTVNSSLSYILSAIREDQPFGLSPGGLARGDYNG